MSKADGGAVETNVITPAGKSYFALNATKSESADWEDGKRLVSEGKNRSCAACIKIFSAEGGTKPKDIEKPSEEKPSEEKPSEEKPSEEKPSGNDPKEQENFSSEGGGGGGGGCVTGSGFAGLIAAVLVSLISPKPSKEVTDLFDKALAMTNE